MSGRHRGALVWWRSAAVSWEVLAPVMILAVVFGVAMWSMRPYPAGVFHDDGVYLILAKALASGEGYRYLHIPGAPAATHYPPGYPLLLAALWRFAPSFPSNIAVFQLANALLLAVVALGVFALARKRLEWGIGLSAGAAVVSTLSLPLLTLAGTVMSESLFLALLFPVLAAGARLGDGAAHGDVAARARDGAATARKRAFVVGLAAGVLTLVRAHGIVAIGAIVLVLLARRRWRSAGWCAGGALAALVPWQIWVALNDAAIPAPLRGSYGSYLGWFADGLRTGGIELVRRTLVTNLGHVAALFADRIAPWPSQWTIVRAIAIALALAFLLLGAWRVARRAPVAVTFFVAYVLVILVWPYEPWRFLWAMWPFVVILIGEGVRGALVRRLFHERAAAASRAVVVAAALVLAVGALTAEVSSYRQRAWETPARSAARDIAPLMRWVSDHTRPSDLLVADAEPLVYLFTGRRVVPPVAFTAREYVQPGPVEGHVRDLAALLRRYPARYVVTIVSSTAAAAAHLAASGLPDGLALREVERLPNGAVFAVEGR